MPPSAAPAFIIPLDVSSGFLSLANNVKSATVAATPNNNAAPNGVIRKNLPTVNNNLPAFRINFPIEPKILDITLNKFPIIDINDFIPERIEVKAPNSLPNIPPSSSPFSTFLIFSAVPFLDFIASKRALSLRSFSAFCSSLKLFCCSLPNLSSS